MTIDTSTVVCDAARTTLKLRIVSGRQHVVRVDRDPRAAYAPKTIDALEAVVEKAAANADAVLLSDYDKGVHLPEGLRGGDSRRRGQTGAGGPEGERLKGPRRRDAGETQFQRGKGVSGRARFHGAGAEFGRGQRRMRTHRSAVARRLHVSGVMVTRRPHGMSLAEHDGTTVRFPGRQVQARDEAGARRRGRVSDVSRAGVGGERSARVWLGNLAGAVKIRNSARTRSRISSCSKHWV